MAVNKLAYLNDVMKVSIPYRQCLGTGGETIYIEAVYVSIPYRQCLGDDDECVWRMCWLEFQFLIGNVLAMS